MNDASLALPAYFIHSSQMQMRRMRYFILRDDDYYDDDDDDDDGSGRDDSPTCTELTSIQRVGRIDVEKGSETAQSQFAERG